MSLESEQRPWGSWHVIDVEDGFKIKRIHVHPHSRLSLQSHVHRSEHWVVIQGIASCQINDRHYRVHHGESIDIPEGARHRLGNDTDEELVIVEVQLGHYTGEDDITRFEDDYGRHEDEDDLDAPDSSAAQQVAQPVGPGSVQALPVR